MCVKNEILAYSSRKNAAPLWSSGCNFGNSEIQDKYIMGEPGIVWRAKLLSEDSYYLEQQKNLGEGTGREGKGREGKGREGKGREGK